MSARRIRRIVGVMLAATLVGGLTACSTNSSGSAGADQSGGESRQSAEAKTLIDKASGKLTWFDPGPAFSTKKPLTGSKILFITVQLNTPFSQHVLKGVRDGATLVGARVDAADSGGIPAEAARQVAQGVSQKVSAIVIQGIPSAAISAELRSAAAAGIPVIMLFDQPDTGAPSTEQKKVGVVGNVDMCWACEGKLMADAAIAAHGDDTRSVFITAKELTSAVKQEAAYAAEIKRLCPTCKTKTVYVPVAQWSTGLQGAVSTALSDPRVNVVAPVYDLMIPAAQAAKSASQSGTDVSLISGDATITGVAAMAKDPSIKFLSGGPSEWTGWLAVDQWLRHLNGRPPADKAQVPVRALTAQTIKTENYDLSKNADETKWFTDVNLREQFRKLWGL